MNDLAISCTNNYTCRNRLRKGKKDNAKKNSKEKSVKKIERNKKQTEKNALSFILY